MPQTELQTKTQTQVSSATTVAASLMVAVSSVALFVAWGMMSILAMQSLLPANEPAAGGGAALVEQPNPKNHGPQKFIVISGYPIDGTAMTYTKEQVLDAVVNDADSVVNFYRENSFGQVAMVGVDGNPINADDVFGPYALDVAATGKPVCEGGLQIAAFRRVAQDAALPDGLRVIFITTKSCGHGGISGHYDFSTPQKPLRVTFSTAYSVNSGNVGTEKGTIAHEVGHTFGFSEGSYLACDPSPLVRPEDCPRVGNDTYGDPYDVMGSRLKLGQSNASQMDNATWLMEDANAPHRIVTVSPATLPPGNTYELSPISSTAPGLKAIKIPHGFRLNTHAAQGYEYDYLYVEWHVPAGLDAAVAQQTTEYPTDIFNGALLHLSYSRLIHPQPVSVLCESLQSGLAKCQKPLHTALPYGQTYTDPNTGTTLQVGSPTPEGLLPVQITHLGRTDFDPPQNLQLAEVARPAPCTATYRATAEDASGIPRIALTLRTVAGVVTTVERAGSPAEIDVDLSAYYLGWLGFKAYDDAKRTGGIFENLSSSSLGVDVSDEVCTQQNPLPRVTVSSPDLPAPFDTAEQLPYRKDNTYPYYYYGLQFPGSLQSPIPLTFRVTDDVGLNSTALYEYFNYSGADSGGYPTRYTRDKLLTGDPLYGVSVHEVSQTLTLDPGTHFFSFEAANTNGKMTKVKFFLDVAPPPPFTRGEVDGDGVLKITDAIQILDYLFLGNIKDISCKDAADANDDGIVNISDAKFLLDYMFTGNVLEIPEPFKACGLDPTPADNLGCKSFLLCQ